MELVNLTGHEIVIRLKNGEDVVFPPVSTVACASSSNSTNYVNIRLDDEPNGVDIPVVSRVIGETVGIPEPKEGIIYIVSSLVLKSMEKTGRTDLVAPNTGGAAVRDSTGQLIAVYSFTRG